MKFIPKIYILDSDIVNAYACGFSQKNSLIVISKELIKLLSRDELQGVIAHEISHIINEDTTYLLCSGAIYHLTTINGKIVPMASKLGKMGVYISPLISIGLIGQAVCYILLMFISIEREYLADACSALYTRYPKGLADALLKTEYSCITRIGPEYINSLVKASFIVPLDHDKLISTYPSTQNRVKVLLGMTSADYAEYEKEFQKLNNKPLIPKSAIENSKKIPIKKVTESMPEMGVAIACALDSPITKESSNKIKENKEILNANIKKHREVENIVRDLADYISIDCECETKLKIPPVYNNQIIICPHCEKKHVVQKS